MLDLTEGEHLKDVRLRLWKPVALDGTVSDEAGDPLPGLTVVALSERPFGGGARFVVAGRTTTDDRGQYRLDGLAPASYIVAVPSRAAKAVRRSPETGPRIDEYPTLFYPDALAASSAVVITLGSGESRAAVDFHEGLRVGARTVSGTVRGVPADTQVWLIGEAAAGTELDTSATVTDPEGRFSFVAVSPGQYTLRLVVFPLQQGPGRRLVSVTSGQGTQIMSLRDIGLPVPPAPSEPTWWWEQRVSVTDLEPNGVELEIVPTTGARVRGRLVFDGGPKRPSTDQLSPIGVAVRSATGADLPDFPPGRIESNLEFETTGLPPGRYFLDTIPPEGFLGWYPKSITSAGRECLDDGVEVGPTDVNGVLITLTDRPTVLSGSLRESSGLAPEVSIYVFPVDRRFWSTHDLRSPRFRELRPTQRAGFTVTGLPAGEYWIVATTAFAPSGLWRRREFLDRLVPLATRVSLAFGERRAEILNLKKSRWP